MSSPVVADLTRADLNDVLEIEAAQFDDPWTIQILRDELSSTSRRYTKATVQGELMGYLGLMLIESEAHVNTLATRPAAESAGVATALLLDGIRTMIARGVSDLTLEVASRNLRAQRLYERFGFAPVGIRKGYYPKSGDDAIVMWVHDVHDESYTERLAHIERVTAPK
jgi:[ribosomal protein S18]-alanine N-acetyltransferase